MMLAERFWSEEHFPVLYEDNHPKAVMVDMETFEKIGMTLNNLMNMLQTPLSNLQMEILELYSTNLAEDELNELKAVLAKFYAEKAVREADRLWDERNLSNYDMEKWLNE